MAKGGFQPKVGRIGSNPGAKSQRYVNRVIRDMRRFAAPKSKRHGNSFSGSNSGRGYSVGSIQQLHTPQPGRRRVIIKARITRIKQGNLGASQAHLRYIQRDGVTREGTPGELYGRDSDKIDGKAFLEGTEEDRHQFRFIVAPEDSAKLSDLKPFIRDLMQQAESDLDTNLEWVAVDHFNTEHPHTHVIVRGKDDTGQDLVIARNYLSHGLRNRACDLVTMELGPETQQELDQKIHREVQSERFTRIDRSLINDTDMGILTISSSPHLDQQWQSQRMGRLRKLEGIGLAKELKPGVWKLADRTEQILKQIGQRGDIIKTMHRVLKDAGIDRGTVSYSIFDASNSTSKVTGKIVSLGLSDEFDSKHYVLVDGVDGKLHYAEIGRLNINDPPSKDMVVTLRGSNSSGQQQSRKAVARIFIESHIPFKQLTNADGATWLDRKLLSKEPLEFRNQGFGGEANQALKLRQRWLVKESLMIEKNRRLTPKPRLLNTLAQRELSRVASQLQKELRLGYEPTIADVRLQGTVLKSVKLASGRFAVLQRSKEFSLVPWRDIVRQRNGMAISLGTNRGISR